MKSQDGLRYSTFPHGSEGFKNAFENQYELRYSTFPHGSEGVK